MQKFAILVVEDNSDTQYFLKVLLESYGFSVTTANDGADALAMLAKPLPDLVITDLCMPGLSGIDLVRRMRQEVSTAALPVVAMTAFSAEGILAEAREAGADALVQKPLDPMILLEVIDQLLSTPRGHRRRGKAAEY